MGNIFPQKFREYTKTTKMLAFIIGSVKNKKKIKKTHNEKRLCKDDFYINLCN